MNPKFRIAAITDEFSPDLGIALEAMAAIGMTGAELRVVSGKNIMNLTPEELDLAKEQVDAKGMEVISIASPILKCVLPGAGEVDSRFQQDIFASKRLLAFENVAGCESLGCLTFPHNIFLPCIAIHTPNIVRQR